MDDTIKVGTLVLHGKSIGFVEKIVDFNNFASYLIRWPNDGIEWVSIERLSFGNSMCLMAIPHIR